jgi:hypothetical protein
MVIRSYERSVPRAALEMDEPLRGGRLQATGSSNKCPMPDASTHRGFTCPKTAVELPVPLLFGDVASWHPWACA